jgi:UDP-N-acetylmuramate dehydrogenase
MVTAISAEQIIESLRDAGRTGDPTLVLAGGSNVVVADEGFPGTVILLRSAGFEVSTPEPGDPAVELTVEAGAPWDELVAATVTAGWAGIECLSGIPGSTGATPVQNVGAYGQEVAETITAVRAYDRLTGGIVDLDVAECGFGYRTSVFKRTPGRWVVLSARFRLARSTESRPVRYAELARVLGVPLGGTAPLRAVREAVLGLRAGKGMVLDPADPDTYSAGSFFLNPVLDAAAFAALVAGSDAEPPSWSNPDGSVKVSAAWLIEHAGSGKGYLGADGVGISAKHTLALTNRGDGSTAALLRLAAEIRDGVRDLFGITLYPEVTLVNCSF